MNTVLHTKSFELTRFSVVILDFDGVILDTETAQCAAWVHALSKFKLDTSKVNPTQIIGVQDEEIVKNLVDATHADLRAQIQEEKNSYMRLAYETGQVKLVNGVDRFIKSLSSTYTLAIASNSSTKRIVSVLKEHELEKYFQFIVAANHKLPPKPDPAIYLEALHIIGKPVSECIVIEDSIPGLVAAKNAGLFTIAITTGLAEGVLRPYANLVVGSFE